MAAWATHNPGALALALYVHGFAFRDADRAAARDALRRGLAIAQDSGNSYAESLVAAILSRVEAEHGDPLSALDSRCSYLAARGSAVAAPAATCRHRCRVISLDRQIVDNLYCPIN
jgi:hypothetical protein